MDTELETLKIIDTLQNACASDIAKSLGITPTAFSNRVNKLKKKQLITYTKCGKEKRYSLTDSGKALIMGDSREPSAGAPAVLMDILEISLKESFDDTYHFSDLFFMYSLPALSLQGDFKTEFRFLLKKLYNNLNDYVCIAHEQNYDKTQFISHLLSTGNYSNETKGLVYYIAEKYQEFRKRQTVRLPIN